MLTLICQFGMLLGRWAYRSRVVYAIFWAYLVAFALAARALNALKPNVTRALWIAVALVGLTTVVRAQSVWPPVFSIYDQSVYRLNLFKVAGAEMTDPAWAHLHQGMAEAQSVTLGFTAVNARSNEKPLAEMTDVQVRWTVKGTPVSAWLNAPFTFTLTIDNPALPALDGIVDIAVEVQGAGRDHYTYSPLFLHLARGRQVADDVPVLSRDMQYAEQGVVHGAGVRYIRYADMSRVGRPADPTVTPWHTPTWQTPGLFQEALAPHTNIFEGRQMWWEEPYDGPHAGLKFARALVPKWDEDHRGLRQNWHHDLFPFVDGPRGIAWTSTYVMGQVDPQGNFCFVEAGGPLRCMAPDGTVTTLVGWHVAPGKDPVWVLKTREQVRHNEVFEGQFLNGRYADGDGFRTPLDVAIDPTTPKVYYIAGYEDQVIWKADCRQAPCQVSVFAGDVAHGFGFVDGTGTAARFSGPASLVFDPVCDCLYVADQNNDAIRKITRAGVVSTLFGTPGQDGRQVARGVTSTDRYAIQGLNRTAAAQHYTRGPGSSVPLETYLPQAIRVDSTGAIVLLDLGFGGIRRIDPTTLAATHLAAVNQRFDQNDEGAPNQGITGSARGFAFLDVDRWGNAGERDAVYFGAFQNSNCDGEAAQHMNEAYCVMPITGAPAHFIFPPSWNPLPDGWGPRELTSPPHYFWLMVVDPRGALILGGGGEHGLTRLRAMRPTDPTFFTENEINAYGQAKLDWFYGVGGLVPTPVLRNGPEAHSALGLPDAQDFVTAPDAAIVQAFGLGVFDAGKQAALIQFVRLNGQAWGAVPTQVPGPPPPPVPLSAVCHTQLGTPTNWELVPGDPTRQQITRTDVQVQDTPAANGGAPCTPAPGTTQTVVVDTRAVPPPIYHFGVARTATSCAYAFAIAAADAPGPGAKGQLYQGSTKVGAVIATLPATRTKTGACGLVFSLVWTKADGTTITATPQERE